MMKFCSMLKTSKPSGSILLSLVLLLVLHLPGLAIPQVIASVDQTEVPLNETFTLIVSATEIDVQSIDFLQDTADYGVMATSSSSNFSYINGKSTSSKTFKFVIRAKHAGQIELPSVSVNSGANVYNTQPIIITVTPPTQAAQTQQAIRPGSQATKAINRNSNSNTKVIAKISVANSSPYTNQQIPLVLKIYHKGNLRSLNIPPLKLDNFISEKSDQAKEYQETVGMDDYLVYEIDFMLFPVKAGAITIPSNHLKAIVIEDNNNMALGGFDPFRLMNPFLVEREIDLETNSLQLNVRELPKGAPKGFSGYVGELSVSHNLKQDSVKAGEALNIQTRIHGSGDASSLDLNFINESKLFSVFKDKDNRKEQVSNGMKYFDLVTNTAVIPNKSTGKLAIEISPIISFNPHTGKYESHGAKRFEVAVLENPDAGSNTTPIPQDETHQKKQKKIVPKEIYVIPENEINTYKALPINIKYLIILLIVLNLIVFVEKLFRYIVKADRLKATNNNGSNKSHLKVILKSEDIAEISKLVKDLTNNLNQEALNNQTELRERINKFFQESDRANYSMRLDNHNPKEKLEYFRTHALDIIKEVDKLGLK